MRGPHIQQTLQKRPRLKQRRLIQLLLPQIVVIMHRMHQRTNHVNRRVRNSVIVSFQRRDHFQSNRFPQSARGDLETREIRIHLHILLFLLFKTKFLILNLL